MDEVDDDSHVSDLSDTESGIETQSSGFVDLSDRTLSEDDISLKSESMVSNGRHKKRVTFQNDENLVLIREIPPRDNKSDTDTAVESGSETSSESDTESDTEELEEVLSEKAIITKNPGVQKKNYDIGQASGRSVTKVAQITGAKVPQQQEKNKNNDIKKIVKRRKRKQLNSAEVTDDVTKSVNKSNKTTKCKQIPKPKTIKTTKIDKQEQDTKNNNHMKRKQKLKETCKITGNKNSITRERPKSAPVESSADHCSSCPQCFRKNRSSDTNFIKNSNGIRCHCLKLTSGPFWEIDSDLSELKHMDNIFLRNSNGGNLSNSLSPQTMHEFSSFHKLDMKLMSKTNKRLYSWLMANGNIPNPRDEAPSISPMWDSSQSTISENSTIKAPT